MKVERLPVSGSWSRELADRWGHASLSSLRTVGTTLANGLRAGYDSLTVETTDKEALQVVKFACLEYGTGRHLVSRRVLLLGYQTGFQVWNLEEGTHARELASRRDGAVRYHVNPGLRRPAGYLSSASLLYVQGYDGWRNCLFGGLDGAVAFRSSSLLLAETALCALEHKFRDLDQRHTYIHTITVASRVLALRCSCRILTVALDSQILAYDIATLELSFSVMTHPAPGSNTPGASEDERAATMPLALGPRWLAYAANQGVQAAAGCAIAQTPAGHHGPGGGASGGGLGAYNYEAMSSMAKSAAKLSGKQLRTFGEAGFRYLAAQYDTWRGGAQPGPDGLTLPGSDVSSQRHGGSLNGASDISGTVMVRDVVSRAVIAHFRAHTSPLLVLEFDPSGTLLVTASVHGHSIHIFQICPHQGGRAGAAGSGVPCLGSAIHLFRLSRGVTPAVIQGVAFSSSGDWLAVSSARGTAHLFHLTPPSTHASHAATSASTPPHLAAAAQAGRRLSATSGALSAAPAPVKLVASGRVRSGGAGLLSGNIPGSAAASAAVSLYSGPAGSAAVASTFAPHTADAKTAHGRSECEPEDVLTMSADGLLTRHCLRPALHTHPNAQQQSVVYGSTPDSVISVDRAQEPSGEVVVEPVVHYDICRRRTWPEREEPISMGPDSPEAATPLTPDQQRQQWMAAAETWVPGAAPTHPLALPSAPLWADDQFHILEMQTGRRPGHSRSSSLSGHEGQSSAAHPLDGRYAQEGYREGQAPASVLQVEDVPTRRVSVQRGVLSPVITDGAESTVWRGSSLSGHKGPTWSAPHSYSSYPGTPTSMAGTHQGTPWGTPSATPKHADAHSLAAASSSWKTPAGSVSGTPLASRDVPGTDAAGRHLQDGL